MLVDSAMERFVNRHPPQKWLSNGVDEHRSDYCSTLVLGNVMSDFKPRISILFDSLIGHTRLGYNGFLVIGGHYQ